MGYSLTFPISFASIKVMHESLKLGNWAHYPGEALMAFKDIYKNTISDDEKDRVIEEALKTEDGRQALVDSITNRNFPSSYRYDPTPVKFITDKLVVPK